MESISLSNISIKVHYYEQQLIMINNYEMMFIVPGTVSEAESTKVLENVHKEIKANKGKVGETDKWGKRKFAYKIKQLTEGYYFLTNFEIDGANVKELFNSIRIMDNVTRYLIVKLA